MGPTTLPARDFPFSSRKEKVTFCHIINPSLTKLVRSRGLYIGLIPFCVLIITMTKFLKLIGYQLS